MTLSEYLLNGMPKHDYYSILENKTKSKNITE